MAADAIESVTSGKLPNALAIVTDRRSPQNRNRTVKRLLRVRGVSCLLDTSVEERSLSSPSFLLAANRLIFDARLGAISPYPTSRRWHCPEV
jgi:hypothetical protein